MSKSVWKDYRLWYAYYCSTVSIFASIIVYINFEGHTQDCLWHHSNYYFIQNFSSIYHDLLSNNSFLLLRHHNNVAMGNISTRTRHPDRNFPDYLFRNLDSQESSVDPGKWTNEKLGICKVTFSFFLAFFFLAHRFSFNFEVFALCEIPVFVVICLWMCECRYTERKVCLEVNKWHLYFC